MHNCNPRIHKLFTNRRDYSNVVERLHYDPNEVWWKPWNVVGRFHKDQTLLNRNHLTKWCRPPTIGEVEESRNTTWEGIRDGIEKGEASWALHCLGNFLFLIPSCVYGGNIPHGCQMTVETYLVCEFFCHWEHQKIKRELPLKLNDMRNRTTHSYTDVRKVFNVGI